MRNKGFTLAEILGVIVVIGLLLLLVSPVIINRIRGNKEKVADTTSKIIESAVIEHINDNKKDYPSGKSYCITIKALIDEGKLVSPIKDVVSGKILDDYTLLVRIESDGTIEIEIMEDMKECKLYRKIPFIEIIVENKDTWSKEKKVIIKYPETGNTEYTIKGSDYKYKTPNEQNDKYDVNDGLTKEVTVTEKGKVKAQMKYGKKTITAEKEINNIDNTYPIITINAYKRTQDNKKTGKIIGTAETTKTKHDTILNTYSKSVNGWLNKTNYPYGIYYEVSIEEDNSVTTTWGWNSANLTQDSSNFNKIIDGKTGTNKTQVCTFEAEGYRYGRYSVTDIAGNTSYIDIYAPIDRSISMGQVSYSNQKAYISASCIDNLSGAKKNKVSAEGTGKRTQTLSITCEDMAENKNKKNIKIYYKTTKRCYRRQNSYYCSAGYSYSNGYCIKFIGYKNCTLICGHGSGGRYNDSNCDGIPDGAQTGTYCRKVSNGTPDYSYGKVYGGNYTYYFGTPSSYYASSCTNNRIKCNSSTYYSYYVSC